VTKIVQHFWQIFSSDKSAPANNRKKGFYTNRDLNKQEVGFIFYEQLGSQNFEVFPDIQNFT
jgi:hypothetical protein